MQVGRNACAAGVQMSELLEILKDILMSLVPEGGADWHWKISVSTVLGGLVVGTISHVAIACGFLQWAGLSGFALASDVAVSQHQLLEIRITQLDNDILETRMKQCKAIAAKNLDAMSFAEQRLDTEFSAWNRLTNNRPYRLPECGELGG